MLPTFKPGDRVVIRAFFARGLTGTVLRRRRLLNLKRGWVVELDRPPRLWPPRATVAERALYHIDDHR